MKKQQKLKKHIDQSTTNNDVDRAKTDDGASAITKFNQTLLKKSEAKRAIDDEVAAKKAEIDQNQKQLKKKKMQLKRK